MPIGTELHSFKLGRLPRSLLPPSCYVYETIIVETETISPIPAPRDIVFIDGYRVEIRRRFDGYNGSGPFLYIIVKVDPRGKVLSVEHAMKYLKPWKKYPTLSISESFEALNSGRGGVLPPEYWGGTAKYLHVWYRDETRLDPLVQPSYVFVVEKDGKKFYPLAPAIKESCYRSNSAFTSDWTPDRVSPEQVKARLKRRQEKILTQEKSIWYLKRPTLSELNKLSLRGSAVLRTWELAICDVDQDTLGEFIKFGVGIARGHLEKANRSMLSRPGKLALPIDGEHVEHAENILKLLKSIPGSGIDPEKVLGKYKSLVKWAGNYEIEPE